MSLDAVASRAGTTKPTIYSRFHSKASLAIAALESLPLQTPRERTGDLRADLIEELTFFRNGALRGNGITLLAAVLVERHDNPDLHKRLRESVIAPRRRNLRTILRDGRDSAGQSGRRMAAPERGRAAGGVRMTLPTPVLQRPSDA